MAIVCAPPRYAPRHGIRAGSVEEVNDHATLRRNGCHAVTRAVSLSEDTLRCPPLAAAGLGSVAAAVAEPLVPQSPAWSQSDRLEGPVWCGDEPPPGLEHIAECNDPAGVIISESDASATEGPDATIDFEVSLTKPHPSRSVTIGLVDFRLYGGCG